MGITQHLTPNRRNSLGKIWQKMQGFARAINLKAQYFDATDCTGTPLPACGHPLPCVGGERAGRGVRCEETI
jgi:hypothetical protein